MGALSGLFKIVAEEGTGKLLGVHIAGAHASDLIAEATFALQKGCSARDLFETIHAHRPFGRAVRSRRDARLAPFPQPCRTGPPGAANSRRHHEHNKSPGNLPEDLGYTARHVWARTDGDTLVIGITDFAQDQLGEILFVDLPDAGASFGADERIRDGGIPEDRQFVVYARGRKKWLNAMRRWKASQRS